MTFFTKANQRDRICLNNCMVTFFLRSSGTIHFFFSSFRIESVENSILSSKNIRVPTIRSYTRYPCHNTCTYGYIYFYQIYLFFKSVNIYLTLFDIVDLLVLKFRYYNNFFLHSSKVASKEKLL